MRALILPAAAMALAGAVVLVGGRMVETPAIIEPDRDDCRCPESGGVDSCYRTATAGSGSGRQACAGRCTARGRPIQPRRNRRHADSDFRTREHAPSAAQRQLAKETARSRLVAPAIVAPPDLAAEELQREAPREPLSQLSLALPPKPEMKNEWAGTAFFGRSRSSRRCSNRWAAPSRSPASRACRSTKPATHEGVSWPCGVRARTAFRLWLRGRALVCQLPDEEQAVTSARCRLGKQDAGAWLVANGWARAAPDGPYVQAEEKARAAKMGIFGGPPDTSSISDVPDAPVSTSAESQPIMTEEGIDPQPALGPELEFPPAPPAP